MMRAIDVIRRGVSLDKIGETVVAKDHSLSAQWEHTVLVTDHGYDILTVA